MFTVGFRHVGLDLSFLPLISTAEMPTSELITLDSLFSQWEAISFLTHLKKLVDMLQPRKACLESEP